MNFEGCKLGRLTVIGTTYQSEGQGKSWQVECSCGTRETRKGKSIKKWLTGKGNDGREPMCSMCGYRRRLRMGIYREKTVGNPISIDENTSD